MPPLLPSPTPSVSAATIAGRAVLHVLHLLQLHQIVHHGAGILLLVVHRVHDLALGARRGVGRGHQSEPMVDRRARPLLLHQATVQLNQVWRALRRPRTGVQTAAGPVQAARGRRALAGLPGAVARQP